MMFTLVLYSGYSEFGDLRLTLQGFDFKLPLAGNGELTIGGRGSDSTQGLSDHIRVRTIGQRAVTIGVDRSNVVLATHNAEVKPDTMPEGLVVIKSAPLGGDLELANTYQLVDGDRLVETGPGARVWTWRAETKRLEIIGSPCRPIPTRKSTIPMTNIGLPIVKNNDADLAIFPIQVFGRTSGVAGGQTAGLSTGAFLHWGGGYFNRNMMVTLTDPGLELETSGARRTFNPLPVVFASADTTAKVMVCRVDYRTPESPEEPGGRVTDLREMTLRRNEWRLQLELRTPSVLTIDNEALEPDEDGKRPSLFLYDRHHAEMADRKQHLLDFSVCGDRLLRELFCRIQPLDDGQFEITVPSGIRRVDGATTFVAGEDIAAVLNIAHLKFPVGLIVVAWLGALLTLIASRGPGRAPLVFVVIISIQYLLAWRLLIGVEGSMLDSGAAASISRSAAAYLLVPTLLAVLARLTGVSLIFSNWRHFCSSFWDTFKAVVPLLVAILGSIILLKVDYAPRTEALVFVALGLTVGLGLFRPKILTLFRLESTTGQASLRFVILFTSLLFFFRFALLVLFGAKEAVNLGTRFTLSILADPAFALVLAIAWQLQNPGRNSEAESWWKSAAARSFCGVAAAVGGMVFTYVMVRDSGGLLIMALPAVLLLPLWKGRRRWPLYILAALYLIVLVVAPLTLNQSGVGGPSHEGALGDQDKAREYVSRRLNKDRNTLRVLSWVNPDRVRDYGTRRAEDLSIVFENIHDYATQGPLGRGYMRSRLSPVLRTTHLNDNLTAVHIMGPFGWAGTCGLVAVLVQLAALPVMIIRRRGSGHMTGTEVLGILCLWIVASSGIYMIAANANLVVFTGKNAILLAASSLGDLIHGLVLAFLAVLCFASTGRVRQT